MVLKQVAPVMECFSELDREADRRETECRAEDETQGNVFE
jgi:hypothetical protein